MCHVCRMPPAGPRRRLPDTACRTRRRLPDSDAACPDTACWTRPVSPRRLLDPDAACPDAACWTRPVRPRRRLPTRTPPARRRLPAACRTPTRNKLFSTRYKKTRSQGLLSQRKEGGSEDRKIFRVPSMFAPHIVHSVINKHLLSTYYICQALLQALGKQFEAKQAKASCCL